MTEESVLVNGAAFGRPQDGEWVGTQESIESLVFGGLDETAGDFEARLVRLVMPVDVEWTETKLARPGGTVYRGVGQPGERQVELETDDAGRVVRISIHERPRGAGSDDPRRFETTLRITDIDATAVDIPSDVPTG